MITGAFMAGVVVLLALGSVAVTTGYFDPPPLAGLPAPVTWAVALYVLGTVLVAPLLKRKVLENGASDAEADDVLEAHLRAVIVAMALRDGGAIVGIVLGVFTDSLFLLLVLGLSSLLAMARAWPRPEEVMRLLREVAGDPAG